jgi:hypothetical protein
MHLSLFGTERDAWRIVETVLVSGLELTCVPMVSNVTAILCGGGGKRNGSDEHWGLNMLCVRNKQKEREA